MYIKSIASISPQKTFDNSLFLEDLVEYSDNQLKCIEPDYNGIIDGKLIRRMSRIIKMGVATALQSLKEKGISNPSAIIVGTAYGCSEDTEIFLKKMVVNNETLLTPTAFIQSTHNTIAASIALLLNCTSHNNTFVNKSLSFESALIDGKLILAEKKNSSILVGGIDEMTPSLFSILTRFGLFRRNKTSNLSLLHTVNKGTIAGEGATFFVLSNNPSPDDYCEVSGIKTFYNPSDINETENKIYEFLKENSTDINDVNVVILGSNGDMKNDLIYKDLKKSIFLTSQTIDYKFLCGEYPTSTSFALWIAAKMYKYKILPTIFGDKIVFNQKNRNVLIYNHFQNQQHSLILLKDVQL